jgi:hypothetical protein
LVADKDGVVVIVRMMGDVVNAELTAGSVPGGSETAGVVATDSDIDVEGIGGKVRGGI